MTGVVPDAIGCIFDDFDSLELSITGMVDLGQYFEFHCIWYVEFVLVTLTFAIVAHRLANLMCLLCGLRDRNP
uniref:Uncharacterized protein n=1 Tax=Solanum tuberosum TaxID=4113 RepID=M1DQK2_SOLTU